MNFFSKNKKIDFFFVRGIILDHFRHPKSIFGIENLKFYKKSICRLKKTGKNQENSPVAFLIGLARDQWTLVSGYDF